MNLFTADVGQGKVHVYDSGNDQFYGKLPQENLINLNIPKLKRGDNLIVECAHLREAHRFTLAQPFDYDQLEELKKNAKEMCVTIVSFPQKATPKARKLLGVEVDAKTDEADTKAIAQFLLKDKSAFYSLKEFFPKRLDSFKDEISSTVEYIKECNADINPAKSSEYGFGKIDYDDEVSKWIKKYALKLVEYLGNDPELIAAIGLGFDKKGKVKVLVPNRIYTLVHSILRPNGDLRFRPDVERCLTGNTSKHTILGANLIT